jgi:hypothetical protein
MNCADNYELLSKSPQRKKMKKTPACIIAFLLFTALVLAETPAPDSGAMLNIKGVTIVLGGFVEGAGIYRSANTNSDIGTPFGRIPLGNSAGFYQNETEFSARRSRLSLRASGDYDPDTHLSGYYEMDFLGAAATANSNESNSYNPRIRHLFAALDWDKLGLHLLAGQTWSLATPNNNASVTNPLPTGLNLLIDNACVVGATWAWQPQFRVVKNFGKALSLAVSTENPQTTVASQPNSVPINYANSQGPGSNFAVALSVNALPDFVGKIALDPGWGHFEVLDLVRNFKSNLKTSTGSLTDTGITTDAVGGGVILPVVPGMFSLVASGLFGSGIGRYGSALLPDVTQNKQGIDLPLTGSQILTGINVTPTPALALYAFYGQEQLNRLSFTNAAGDTGYGYGSDLYNNSGADSLGGTVNGNIRKISEVTAGGWWKFYQGKMGRMQLGVQYGHVENFYFNVIKGGAPTAIENMVFVSVRYYW